MKALTIYVDDEVDGALAAMAAAGGRDKGQLAAELLRRQLLGSPERETPGSGQATATAIHTLLRNLESIAGPLGVTVAGSAARVDAAVTLGRLGDPRAIAPLITALGQPYAYLDEPLERAAADALVRLGKPAVVPLIRALRNQFGLGMQYWADRAWREAVGRGRGQADLAFLADEAAAPVLVRSLTGAGPGTCRQVVAGWVALAPEVVAPLLTLVDQGDPTLALWAGEALGRIGTPEAVQRLSVLLEAGDPDTVVPAAVGLAYRGDPRAVELLCRALLSSPARDSAARALGEMGARAALALAPLRAAIGREPDRGLRAVLHDAVRRIEAAVARLPAELEASSAPAGSGTELESAGPNWRT